MVDRLAPVRHTFAHGGKVSDLNMSREDWIALFRAIGEAAQSCALRMMGLPRGSELQLAVVHRYERLPVRAVCSIQINTPSSQPVRSMDRLPNYEVSIDVVDGKLVPRLVSPRPNVTLVVEGGWWGIPVQRRQ